MVRNGIWEPFQNHSRSTLAGMIFAPLCMSCSVISAKGPSVCFPGPPCHRTANLGSRIPLPTPS